MFAIYTFGQDEKKGQAEINQVEVVRGLGVAASLNLVRSTQATPSN
jgi:hypothetical protein